MYHYRMTQKCSSIEKDITRKQEKIEVNKGIFLNCLANKQLYFNVIYLLTLLSLFYWSIHYFVTQTGASSGGHGDLEFAFIVLCALLSILFGTLFRARYNLLLPWKQHVAQLARILIVPFAIFFIAQLTAPYIFKAGKGYFCSEEHQALYPSPSLDCRCRMGGFHDECY